MAFELIATGNVIELADLGDYEGAFPEPSQGMLQLDLRMEVPQTVIDELNGLLKSQGVDAFAETGSPLVNVYFSKNMPWLALIAAIILGLIALAILIIGWRLYLDVVEHGVIPGAPDWMGGVAVSGAVITAGIIALIALILLARRR